MERQAGGKTRGMGEKQIEVDKRLLRLRMAQLRRQIEEVTCCFKHQMPAGSVLRRQCAASAVIQHTPCCLNLSGNHACRCGGIASNTASAGLICCCPLFRLWATPMRVRVP